MLCFTLWEKGGQRRREKKRERERRAKRFVGTTMGYFSLLLLLLLPTTVRITETSCRSSRVSETGPDVSCQFPAPGSPFIVCSYSKLAVPNSFLRAYFFQGIGANVCVCVCVWRSIRKTDLLWLFSEGRNGKCISAQSCRSQTWVWCNVPEFHSFSSQFDATATIIVRRYIKIFIGFHFQIDKSFKQLLSVQQRKTGMGIIRCRKHASLEGFYSSLFLEGY